MAISILHEELKAECDGDIFAENYTKYCCDKCHNGIKKFTFCAPNKRFFGSKKFN
jgi:hypothetical protein